MNDIEKDLEILKKWYPYAPDYAMPSLQRAITLMETIKGLGESMPKKIAVDPELDGIDEQQVIGYNNALTNVKLWLAGRILKELNNCNKKTIRCGGGE